VAITIAGMNIQTVRTAPRSPWQNAYAERVIGSIRRECLDHVIVANAAGLDYIHEVDHVAARIERLEAAIDAAVQTAPARMRTVIEALQALRGIALVTAVTIAAEVGELSRFAKPRQLMDTAVPSRAKIRVASGLGAAALRKRATRISVASSSRPGPIGTARRWGPRSGSARPPSVPR
jgi:transposase